jgi:hypothetical protein
MLKNIETKIIRYKTITGLAQLVQLMFLISALVAVASIISEFMQANLLIKALHGKYVTMAQALANDDRQAIIGWITFGVYIISAIIFLIWVYRANKNLHAFKNPTLRFSPGWAVGWWFVPIMSLFRPYQVVNEIKKASNPDIDASIHSVVTLTASPIVGIWWAFFLTSHYIGWFAFRYILRDDTINDLLNATYAYIASDTVDIVGFIITIIMVRKISQSQDKRYLKTIEMTTQAA